MRIVILDQVPYNFHRPHSLTEPSACFASWFRGEQHYEKPHLA